MFRLSSLFRAHSPILRSLSTRQLLPTTKTVVAMVVGEIDRQKAVIVGQRKVSSLDCDDLKEKPYGLPGGYVEPDECFISAALRQLKEKTGICLKNQIEKNLLEPKIIYNHRVIAAGVEHQKVFVLCDLGNALKSMELHPQGKLIDARVISIASIKKTEERYSIDINDAPKTMRSTNGLLITAHHSERLSSVKDLLNDLSDLEHKQGGRLLFYAINHMNRNRIFFLIKNGALDQASQSTKKNLIDQERQRCLDDVAAIIAIRMVEQEIALELDLPLKNIHLIITPDKEFNIKIENEAITRKNIEKMKYMLRRLDLPALSIDNVGNYWLENITNLSSLFENGHSHFECILPSEKREMLRLR